MKIKKWLAVICAAGTMAVISPTVSFAAETEVNTSYVLEYNPGEQVAVPLSEIENAWEGMNKAKMYAEGIGEIECNYNYPKKQLDITIPWNRDVKKGTYQATIDYWQTGNNNTAVDKESIQIYVKEDITGVHLINTDAIFTGNNDVVFRFKNGKGDNRITEITELNFQARTTHEGEEHEDVPGFAPKSSSFSYDLDGGEIVIPKEYFQKNLSGEICQAWVMPWVYKGVMDFKLANGQVIKNLRGLIPYLTNEGVPKEEFVNDGTDKYWYFREFAELDELPFTDVPSDAWFYDSVKYVYDNGLMTGLNDTTFGPAESLARAQFAVILHRMNGEPKVEYSNRFLDVPDNQWFTDAILWANDIGVVNGYTDTGLFGTSDMINREQMAVMMYRYANYMKYDTSQKADFSKFQDADSVNQFAREAMEWAVGSGIITGTDGGTKINPQGNANRAECATIIMRFCEKYGKPE